MSIKALLGEDCSQEWIEFLTSQQATFRYAAGDVILREGDPMEGIYVIDEGKIKVVIEDHGEERLVRLAGNGDILGHRGLGGDRHYPVSAIALVPCELNFIPMSVFNLLAKTNVAFVFNLMMFLAEELRISEQNHIQMPVLNRVARTLLRNYQAFGFEEGSNRLSYTISRREIASHASTTYESVIRALTDLAKRGVIRLDGKAIRIVDLGKLEALVKTIA